MIDSSSEEPSEEEDQLNSLDTLKRKGNKHFIARTSPKRQRKEDGDIVASGSQSLSAKFSRATLLPKTNRPRASEPGLSRPNAITGPSPPVTSPQRLSKSPRPFKPSKPIAPFGRKEALKTGNAGLPVFSSRSSSKDDDKSSAKAAAKTRVSSRGPVSASNINKSNKGPPPKEADIISISSGEDEPPAPKPSIARSASTSVLKPLSVTKPPPPTKITVPPVSKPVASSSKLPILNSSTPPILDGNGGTSAASRPATTNTTSTSNGVVDTARDSIIAHQRKLSVHARKSSRGDESDIMDVNDDANQASTSQLSAKKTSATVPQPAKSSSTIGAAPITTNTKAPVSGVKPMGILPLPGRHRSSLSRASKLEASYSQAPAAVDDIAEPRPPAQSWRSSGLDMSGLKDVLTHDVELSPSRRTQALQPEQESSRPSTSSSVKEKRPVSLGGQLDRPSSRPSISSPVPAKYKPPVSQAGGSTSSQRNGSSVSSVPVHVLFSPMTSFRALKGKEKKKSVSAHSVPFSSDIIDLTLDDSDDDSAPPVPAAAATPDNRPIRPKPTPRPLLRPRSSTAAAIPDNPIRPETTPRPLPKPRLPTLSDDSKTAYTPVSAPTNEDKMSVGPAFHTSESPGLLPRGSPMDVTSEDPDSHMGGSEYTSTSSSSSSAAADDDDMSSPPASLLPHRAARKSVRGGRVSGPSLPTHFISAPVLNQGPPTSAPPSEAGSALPSSSHPMVASSQNATSRLLHKLPALASEGMGQMAVDEADGPVAAATLPGSIDSQKPLDKAPGLLAINVNVSGPIVSATPSVVAPGLDPGSDSELEYADAPLVPAPAIVPSAQELSAKTDSSEMMDVEDLLTTLLSPASPVPDEDVQNTLEEQWLDVTPDPLDVLNEVVQPRRSSRSSRSSSYDNYFPDEPGDTASSPLTSPTPDDPFTPAAVKFFGGFESLDWRTYRQNPDNFKPKCYFTQDLPHTLQDTINNFSDAGRRHRSLASIMVAAIRENTADDEPEAPLIEIINKVDDDPTPPWEFHYSNKMWLGEGVPLPDMANLIHCDCIGRCDPKSKTCACARRQHEWVDDGFTAPEFLYDVKGHLKATDYPVFECNDRCGCGDECRNRVVQHGRKCVVSIQKTKEKGWGVFAGAKKIPSGMFIGIYAGELLTDRVGEERGITYNKFGRTYLFDLDFYHLKAGNEDWDIQYTIDAYHAGNFTRFLVSLFNYSTLCINALTIIF
ncbi:hypothetical protein C0991_002162 [Blastosporella zonata]|nr:hypothetical protein C0991_002162 [Blastosporella zonata]